MDFRSRIIPCLTFPNSNAPLATNSSCVSNQRIPSSVPRRPGVFSWISARRRLWMLPRKRFFALLVGGSLALAGCRQDMHNQPRYKPFAPTDFFGDGRSERPVVQGTVARGHLHID